MADTKVPQQSQQHPLLGRLYSTIGIGDFFLDPPPHPLPSEYLAATYQSKSDTNNSSCKFISREIIGTIKSRPEDFIVREIALPGRSISSHRVASLLDDDDSPTTTTTTTAEPKVIVNQDDDEVLDLDELLSPFKRRKVDAPKNKTFNERNSDGKDNEEEETASDQPKTTSLAGTITNPTAPAIADEDKQTCDNTDPLQLLESILCSSLEKNSEDGRDSKDIIESLHNLQNSFLAAIRQSSSASGESTKMDVDQLVQSMDHVWIPPLLITDTKERGEFHRALRTLFPLLLSESVAPEGPAKSGVAKEGYKIKVSVYPLFVGLIPYLYEPHIDLPVLYEFYRCRFDSIRKTETKPVLRLRPDLERKERAPVHRIISSQTHNSLATVTINSYPLHAEASENSESSTTGISVDWSRSTKQAASRKRQQSDGKSDPFPHCLVIVRKYQTDHAKAHGILVSALRCSRADVGFAGKKDLHAVTYQFCTLRGHTPEQVARASKRMASSVQLGPARKVDWLLNIGDCAGNRFEIVLRNVHRVSVVPDTDGSQLREERIACDEDHIKGCLDRIRKFGFINFYGEQRVGSVGERSIVGTRSFEIGRALLLEQWADAMDLIMNGREFCGDNNQEKESIRNARQSWMEHGRNPDITLKLLPKSDYVSKERFLLNALKRFDGDLCAALGLLPKDERRFYVSCYQSYIWNLAATERIRLYGTDRAVPGDLVQPRTSDRPYILQDGSSADIGSVVLPLPGTDTVFPTNQLGDFFQQFFDREGLDIRRQSREVLRGSYRYLIAPACNLQHEILYDDPSTATNGAGMMGVKLQFDIPTGSFATMMLREFMTSTVARVDISN